MRPARPWQCGEFSIGDEACRQGEQRVDVALVLLGLPLGPDPLLLRLGCTSSGPVAPPLIDPGSAPALPEARALEEARRDVSGLDGKCTNWVPLLYTQLYTVYKDEIFIHNYTQLYTALMSRRSRPIYTLLYAVYKAPILYAIIRIYHLGW